MISLKDFKKQRGVHANEVQLADPKFYPCNNCNGRGKEQQFKDRDPIEGYKFAPWYPCEDCKGTGAIPKKEFLKLYKTFNMLLKKYDHEEEYERLESRVESFNQSIFADSDVFKNSVFIKLIDGSSMYIVAASLFIEKEYLILIAEHFKPMIFEKELTEQYFQTTIDKKKDVKIKKFPVKNKIKV